MINKEKIKFNECTYWVPSHTGPWQISILEEKNNGLYVVQSGKNKFLAHIEHIYNKQEHAIQGRRDWEHYERKRKREARKKRKEDKQ